MPNLTINLDDDVEVGDGMFSNNDDILTDKGVPDIDDNKEKSNTTPTNESTVEDENKGFDEKPENEEKTEDKTKVEEEVITIKDQLIQESGLEFEEDELKDIDFESVSGIAQFTKVIAKKNTQNYLDEFFDAQPDVWEYSQHLKNGGTREEFFSPNNIDFDTITLDAKNDVLSEKIYRMQLSTQGIADDEINDMVDLAKDKAKLFDKATKGLEYLKNNKVAIEAQRIAKVEADKKIEKDNTKKYWDSITSTIKTGKLNGVAIPEVKQNEMIDYYTKVNDKGQTKHDIKVASLSLEQKVLLDYIIMNDFKNLGNTPVKVQQIKDLVNQGKDRKDRSGSNETVQNVVHLNKSEIYKNYLN